MTKPPQPPRPDVHGLIDAAKVAIYEVGRTPEPDEIHRMRQAVLYLAAAYHNLHEAAIDFGVVFCEDITSWHQPDGVDRLTPALTRLLDNTTLAYKVRETK